MIRFPLFLEECDDLTRVGRDFDGGYVICLSTLMDTKFLLSFGVSDDWSFERDFIRDAGGIPAHAYDQSISFSKFLFQLLVTFIKFFFRRAKIKVLISAFYTPIKYRLFFRRAIVHYPEKLASKGFNEIEVDIETVFSRIKSNNIFVKIDIEGSEYGIIPQVMRYADRIVGMTIEFHETYILRKIFLESLSLIGNEFSIIHAHGNNFSFVESDLPNVVEISFSKIGHGLSVPILNFPTAVIDQPCDPGASDYIFSIHTLMGNE